MQKNYDKYTLQQLQQLQTRTKKELDEIEDKVWALRKPIDYAKRKLQVGKFYKSKQTYGKAYHYIDGIIEDNRWKVFSMIVYSSSITNKESVRMEWDYNATDFYPDLFDEVTKEEFLLEFKKYVYPLTKLISYIEHKEHNICLVN